MVRCALITFDTTAAEIQSWGVQDSVEIAHVGGGIYVFSVQNQALEGKLLLIF